MYIRFFILNKKYYIHIMALIDALNKMRDRTEKKGWDKVYVAVDIHDVVVKGNYVADVLPTEFFDGAKETLQLLTQLPYVCLIVLSCSHPEELEKYDVFFKENAIHFDYWNENPEVINNALGCYDKKIYFNLYLEDKCGFIESDWETIFEFFYNWTLYKEHTYNID